MAIVIEGSQALYQLVSCFAFFGQGLINLDRMQISPDETAIQPVVPPEELVRVVQPIVQPVVQPVMLSGSVWTQLLTALVIGLLVAFALQVLLTSLGVAIGMSVLAIRASAHQDANQDLEQDLAPDSGLNSAELNSEYESTDELTDIEAADDLATSESSGVQLGFWAGFGVLLTVNTVLFAACFLAARFSQAQNSLTGAIEGIVIWSAYLLILVWLSSTAVSSVVGSLLSVVTGGFRRMIRPIGALFTPEEPAAVTTETEMLAAVRQEIQAAFDPEQLQGLIRAELRRSAVPVLYDQPYNQPSASEQATPAKPPKTAPVFATLQQKLIQFLQDADKLTPKRVDRRLREILDDAQVDLPDSAILPEIDRSMAMRLLMQREDLSEKQREKILNQIEKTWNEVRRSIQEENANQIRNAEENGSATHSAEPNPAIQKLTETTLKTIVEQLPDSITENIPVDRVVQHLPELMQQAGNQIPTGASLAVLMMALIKGKDLLPEQGIDPQQIRQILDRLMEQTGMTHLNQAVGQQVDHLRDRSVQQIEQVQQTVQEKVDTLKTQTSQRLQATQKAATIAAWWLFLTVSTGAISSAVAGAIAHRI